MPCMNTSPQKTMRSWGRCTITSDSECPAPSSSRRISRVPLEEVQPAAEGHVLGSVAASAQVHVGEQPRKRRIMLCLHLPVADGLLARRPGAYRGGPRKEVVGEHVIRVRVRVHQEPHGQVGDPPHLLEQ